MNALRLLKQWKITRTVAVYCKGILLPSRFFYRDLNTPKHCTDFSSSGAMFANAYIGLKTGRIASHSQSLASWVALVVKNLPVSVGDAGDVGLIPGWGRSPGGGHGNPLQYSCLEDPMDRGAWWATVLRIRKRWARLKRLSTKWGESSLLQVQDLFLSIDRKQFGRTLN